VAFVCHDIFSTVRTH